MSARHEPHVCAEWELCERGPACDDEDCMECYDCELHNRAVQGGQCSHGCETCS